MEFSEKFKRENHIIVRFIHHYIREYPIMNELSYENVYWVYIFTYDILYKGKIYPNGYYKGKKRPFCTL